MPEYNPAARGKQWGMAAYEPYRCISLSWVLLFRGLDFSGGNDCELVIENF